MSATFPILLGLALSDSHTPIRTIRIFTLNVTLLGSIYAETECIRTIEIDSSSTLNYLHLAILHPVGFDHLYEFNVSRTERSRDRTRFNNFDGYEFGENKNANEVTLGSLFPLEKARNPYNLFDSGDSWCFQISKSRKKPTKAKSDIRYPRIVESIGEDPEQYPVFED